ncbi:helix-turn-helix transcriptional regulator [Streptomyces sp. MBT53]|uniref:helix-turn-helix transcriptional regulator n=1 Tax=Streptomyces sp. MBT53 TaxID=1488384 RepID=UPI001913DB02|nr:helix-turn-helix transcriptional regulator [Streptomyces sp. MBT53]MBK6014259.1 helix-turn-helix domain-containing protein [Streptomyces sp. MBT53]
MSSSVALGQGETRNVRDADRERRAALRHFLRSRRARLSPGDVGLRMGGRRNTPGLRREEVAVLAGVSASWYTWLEQGRDIKVSGDVLDAVSKALNLDRTERAHLYLLAGVNPPAARQEVTPEELSRLRLAVEVWQPAPAFVVDRYWNVLVSNAPARALLGVQDMGSNYLWSFFTDGRNRSRYPHWLDVASRLVGQFRVQTVRFLDDPNFEQLARRLCSASPDFDRLWGRHETRDTGIATVEVRPAAGRRAAFHHVVMGLHQRSEPLLMLYMPTQIDGDRAG